MAAFANVDVISPKEAAKVIADQDPVVLDVRTKTEFDSGHIEGAINVPIDSLNEGVVAKVIPGKSDPVIVYCKSGIRSSIASGEMEKMGYTGIMDMAGGIDAWPFDIVK